MNKSKLRKYQDIQSKTIHIKPKHLKDVSIMYIVDERLDGSVDCWWQVTIYTIPSVSFQCSSKSDAQNLMTAFQAASGE